MLPRLDHLPLRPTGGPAMRDVMGNVDLVAAILGAIDASDAERACSLAEAWCNTGSVHKEACHNKNVWRTLLNRAFGVDYEGDDPRARFNAMCRRIEQYKNGSLVFGNGAAANNPDTKVHAYVRAALLHDPSALLLRSPFTRDREMVLAAALSYEKSMPFDSPLQFYPEFQNDVAFMLELVRKNPMYWVEASQAVRKRREIVLAAVRGSGDMLYFMTPTNKADKEIVLAALAESPDAVMFASKELQSDPDVLRVAQQGWDEKRRGNDKAWQLFIIGTNRRGLGNRTQWPHWRFDSRGLRQGGNMIERRGPRVPYADPRDQ